MNILGRNLSADEMNKIRSDKLPFVRGGPNETIGRPAKESLSCKDGIIDELFGEADIKAATGSSAREEFWGEARRIRVKWRKPNPVHLAEPSKDLGRRIFKIL